MTPEEINEAVARKLGWKSQCLFPESEGHHGFPCPFKTPDYATDIQAAWEIICELAKKEYEVSLRLRFMPHHQWMAEFDRFDIDPGTPALDGESDSAPMAICLAFLKLSEDETEKQ